MKSPNTHKTASELISPTVRGWRRLFRALSVKRAKAAQMDAEPSWTSDLMSITAPGECVSFSELGYTDDDVSCQGVSAGAAAIVGPFRLLNDAGIRHLSEIVRRLESSAERNEYVVGRRLRAGDVYSRFLYHMIRDRSLLVALSRWSGVPLIPHPLTSARVQVNYYREDDLDSEGIPAHTKWHCDGMDYVLTILLSDENDFEGGQFVYYKGNRCEFEARLPHVSTGSLRVASFRHSGEALFTRGSYVYHCVTPVTRGRRITLVLSFFSPYYASADSNQFWHSAADDGILRTLAGWLRFRIPIHSPDYYFKLVDAPWISWEDIGA